MTPASPAPSDDHIVEPIAPDAEVAALYRIVGVEPHGWSTVLLEDDAGNWFVAVTASRRLNPIARADAEDLIRNRTYRKWQGGRDWATLDRLPLFAADDSQLSAMTADSVDSAP